MTPEAAADSRINWPENEIKTLSPERYEQILPIVQGSNGLIVALPLKEMMCGGTIWLYVDTVTMKPMKLFGYK